MAGTPANAQDLVVLEEITKSTIVLKGGRLLQVVMVGGVNFSLKSEEEQNIMTYAYQNFLNSLDFPAEIIVHSRKINVDKYLASLEERQSKEQSALLQSQIGEYREFIRSFVKDNPIMAKSFFVVVPFSPSAIPQADTFTKFLPFGKKNPAKEQQAAEARHTEATEDISQLNQRVSQVVDGLKAIGLEAEKLSDDALIELFYNFYNPESVERENVTTPPREGGTPQ